MGAGVPARETVATGSDRATQRSQHALIERGFRDFVNPECHAPDHADDVVLPVRDHFEAGDAPEFLNLRGRQRQLVPWPRPQAGSRAVPGPPARPGAPGPRTLLRARPGPLRTGTTPPPGPHGGAHGPVLASQRPAPSQDRWLAHAARSS